MLSSSWLTWRTDFSKYTSGTVQQSCPNICDASTAMYALSQDLTEHLRLDLQFSLVGCQYGRSVCKMMLHVLVESFGDCLLEVLCLWLIWLHFVCARVSVRFCVCLLVSASAFVCLCVSVCVCACVCVYVCVSTCVLFCLFVSVRLCECACACVCRCACRVGCRSLFSGCFRRRLGTIARHRPVLLVIASGSCLQAPRTKTAIRRLFGTKMVCTHPWTIIRHSVCRGISR